MANLSNINNKFIVTDGGDVMINNTIAGYPNGKGLTVKSSNNICRVVLQNSVSGGSVNDGFRIGLIDSNVEFESTESGEFQFYTGGGAAKMTIDSSGNVGIGIATPYSKLQVNGAANTLCSHFGGQHNTNGHYQGISLGYAESTNAGYRKVAIVAQATGDGAARQNLVFLVDGAADGNSASIADNKMILNYDGAIKIGNGSNIAINTNGGHFHAAGPAGFTMRQYQYYVDIPNGSTIDLFQNTSAYSDIQMTKISIVMYHSSRTYFAGMGTVGGYALALTGAGIGQANGGLTAATVSTGIRKLQIANNSGYQGAARIFIEIMADSSVTVLNGSISAPY